jgi:lipopolysaccharide transport system ATP-binding protein
LQPTAGEITVNGRISALLELGSGFNPEFTGKENIYLNAAILGLNKEEIEEKYPDIIAFADIGEHINQPVKTYSSGMYVRLAFAVAVAVDPDILIVDEALAVGDEAFQRKCFSRIDRIKDNGGTILFVSHSAGTIVDLCNRAILLDHGECILQGKPKEVISAYQKMIYAPIEKREKVRNDIKNGKYQVGRIEDKKEQITVKDESQFDSGLKPESTVIYESKGAIISSPRIISEDGKQVNLLERGKRYTYCYDVEVAKTVRNVRFGMMFKTKSGIELSGFSSHPLENTIDEVTADTKLTVEFEFTCLFVSGTYYTNSGCTAIINGERTHLHRIVDACMFSILPEGRTDMAGYIDFETTAKVKYL